MIVKGDAARLTHQGENDLVDMAADRLSPTDRSKMMARVRAKNTAPEMIVRRVIHKMGFRFRLHRRDLPGSPDIALPKLKKVIFVNGCFWHHHEGCPKSKMPVTNAEFWQAKIDANVKRDRIKTKELEELGWSVLVVWECETKKSSIDDTLKSFLQG